MDLSLKKSNKFTLQLVEIKAPDWLKAPLGTTSISIQSLIYKYFFFFFSSGCKEMKMKLSSSSYICLALTLVSIFRAFYLYYDSTQDLRIANEKDPWFFKQQQKTMPYNSIHAGYRNTTERMEDKPNNIFYFIQVSDLHISKFQAKGHTIHFLHFLQSALPVIK